MSFATLVNCIDGRVQQPAAELMKNRFGVSFVDVITVPGADGFIAHTESSQKYQTMIDAIKVSIDAHGSEIVGIAGHFDCAGNPVSVEEHKADTLQAVERMKNDLPETTIIGLWIDDTWQAQVLPNG